MEANRRYHLDSLASVTVPTVVAHGSNTAARLRHVAEALARFLPKAELVAIAGADHDALNSHPAEVAEVIGRSVQRGRINGGLSVR